MTGINVTNEIVAVLAGLITTFLIPWLNKKLHTTIPAAPVESELGNLIKQIYAKPLAEQLKPMPPLTDSSDLGTNPFTTFNVVGPKAPAVPAPQEPPPPPAATNPENVPPNENGAV